jgi:hypothetical protein
LFIPSQSTNPFSPGVWFWPKITSCFWCYRTYSSNSPRTLPGVIPSKRFIRLHSGGSKRRSFRLLDFEARTGENWLTKPGTCSRFLQVSCNAIHPRTAPPTSFFLMHGRLLGLRESWKMRLMNPQPASGVSGIPDCRIELGRKKYLKLLRVFAAFRAARKKSSDTYFAR